MGRPSKKDDILEAALELFAAKGVDATTTREIAARATTAEGNLYRHFEGKDELVRTLFRQCAERFAALLQEEAVGREAPEARLEALVRGIFSFAARSPEAFGFLLAGRPAALPAGSDMRTGPYPLRLFVETLSLGMRQGVFRSDLDPVLTTGWIVAMAQRAILMMQVGVIEADGRRVQEATLQAVRRLVAPDGPREQDPAG